MLSNDGRRLVSFMIGQLCGVSSKLPKTDEPALRLIPEVEANRAQAGPEREWFYGAEYGMRLV